MKKADSLPNILLEISIKALWAPPLVFFLHALAAKRFGHEPYVDPVMHFAGGAAMAWLFWKSACCGRRYLGNPSVMTIVMLAFGLTTLTAIAWECIEYVLSLTNGYSAGWSLTNTLRDLVLGMSGAATVLYFATKDRLRNPAVKHS